MWTTRSMGLWQWTLSHCPILMHDQRCFGSTTLFPIRCCCSLLNSKCCTVYQLATDIRILHRDLFPASKSVMNKYYISSEMIYWMIFSSQIDYHEVHWFGGWSIGCYPLGNACAFYIVDTMIVEYRTSCIVCAGFWYYLVTIEDVFVILSTS